MSEKKTDSAYIVQLDGLRFFAILSVMIGHWLQWQINRSMINAFPFGNGVTLFFVLSGFLITDILLKNRNHSFALQVPKIQLIKSFYIRRILRIFPLYFSILFFLYAISYRNTREIFPWLVSFTSNIYQSIHEVFVGDFNHFWSLAVEEQFYLFWPWVIIFIPAKYSEKIIFSLIGISVLSKVYIFLCYPDNWMANSYFTLSCMHALGIGALIAYWGIYRQDIIQKITGRIWVYSGILAYFSLHYFIHFHKIRWIHEIADNILFAIMSGLIINYAAQNKFSCPAKWILENKFVLYSGKISYGLYVFHLFVPNFFWNYLSAKIGLSITDKYTATVFFYFVTFVLAHFSWICMEKPINDLKKYFPYTSKK